MSIYGWFFSTCCFTNGFLFLVKELGLLTNACHWIRILDVIGSYMYIVLETMYGMNEYRICGFSQFEFPGEKSLCNVCIFHCIFYVILLKICLQ
jgi:hypothetical protein